MDKKGQEISPELLKKLQRMGSKLAREQSRTYSQDGERARRRRQIERGQLCAENGLVSRGS